MAEFETGEEFAQSSFFAHSPSGPCFGYRTCLGARTCAQQLLVMMPPSRLSVCTFPVPELTLGAQRAACSRRSATVPAAGMTTGISPFTAKTGRRKSGVWPATFPPKTRSSHIRRLNRSWTAGEADKCVRPRRGGALSLRSE